MDPVKYVYSLACLTAWREERSNGYTGMLGVLFLIRNRRDAGWEDGNIFQILTDKNQFSSMTVPGDANTAMYGDPRDPEYQKILQAVDPLFGGYLSDSITGRGLYYADLSCLQKGGWFDRVILANPERFPRVASVRTTTYFGDAQDPWYAKGKS